MANQASGTSRKKREIEDSDELRAAIADLESKRDPALQGEALVLQEREQHGDAAERVYEEVLADSAGEEGDSYEEAYDDDLPENYYDEDNYTDDAFDEEIEMDSFADRIDQTAPLDGIGEAILHQERERESRRAQERALSRERRSVREDAQYERYDAQSVPDKASGKKAGRGDKGRKRRKRDDNVIISLEGVSKSYDRGVPALNDVNIKIRKGEFVFIVGGSGSGKSTLIRLLLRELQPTKGQIMVNGFRVDNMRRRKIPKLRRSIGVVFQDFRLLQDRNVYENVAFAQRIIQTPAREMKRNVPNMLATVGLAGKYSKRPEELSGGEQQRVALARALVNKPPILLCDEPTGNLDPRMTIEIMNLLDKINQNGTTVVVVTHNEKIVNDMQKRVITIKKGVVISDEEKGVYIDED